MSAPESTQDHAHEAGEPHVHITSPKLLLGVFGGLIFLTIITVAISYAEGKHIITLGPFSILVAMVIAAIKAGLVAMYFMHLRWDSPFHGLTLIGALLFVAIFIAFTIYDSNQYKDNYNPPGSGQTMSTKYGH